MLEIKSIKKEYRTGELIQKALDDVSVCFRDNEFVSILGPSGSGKTTLLNIVGGLDSYDSGDLVINGISTKHYKDRDWDVYRNHTIGFVFQSYNLIPHQTVLGNVELALTIAGISKSERKKRAKDALIEVGLEDHINKKPNQLSGGQMQRVAIARALVNNPEILLADEPTGALDTQTSIQIMDVLKKVAKDRLVIMVTHNPELAKAYSSRIVKLQDGKIVDDTNPVEVTTNAQEPNVMDKNKKAKMSIFTSLSLSFNNLKTKKKRTLLTSFAGSIGIIGIALILSFSTGVNTYIETLQRDTMSAYPITLTAETMDMTSVMQMSMADALNQEKQEDAVYPDYSSLEVTNSLTIENNLTDFKNYLDDSADELEPYLGEAGIVYSYNVNFSVFSYDEDENLINSNASTSDLTSDNAPSMGPTSGQDPFSAMMSGGGATSVSASNFTELMKGTDEEPVNDIVKNSYDLVDGQWPTQSNELVLFLDENNAVPVETLYQLGLMTGDEYTQIAENIENDEEVKQTVWNYDDVMNHTMYMVPACERYEENEDGTFSYITDDEYATNKELIEDTQELKIVGIAKRNEETSSLTISTSLGYTALLTEEIIKETNESPVITAQENDKSTNVLTGIEFEAVDDKQKAEDAKVYISSLGVSDKAELLTTLMYYGAITMPETQTPSMPQDGNAQMPTSTENAVQDETAMAAMLDQWLEDDPDEEILVSIYDESLGSATYDDNMSSFGKVSYDAPTAINIYTDTFEDKEAITNMITEYNQTVEKENQITYVDYVEAMTSSMTTMIDVISYVLIAFVAVSLIVSCIMIGIITHISVLERTKEIGVLRALGASKSNISQVFNAETMIIGLCSGLLGIGIAILLNIPITAIVQNLLGDANLIVNLPIISAVILVAISVLITILGGLLPSRKAAKKDPVIALRTE